MFQLGVITDEVSQDFEIALQFAERHGLDCVELRSAWEKGPFEFTEDDILKIKALKEFGCNRNTYNPYQEGDTPQFRAEKANWF